jgi:hypothetical protein
MMDAAKTTVRAGRRAGLAVSSLAVVVMFGGCSGSGVAASPARVVRSVGIDENATEPRSPVPTPVLPHLASAGTNRKLAVTAAARAIADFPVPPGATRIDRAPPHAGTLRRLKAFIGRDDLSLTRTRWWLVPLRYNQVVDWYVEHTPAKRGSTQYHSGGRPAPDAEVYWETHVRTAAYSPPAEVVGYARLGPHLTALLTGVTLAARFDRTSNTLVPTTVTSLQVTRQAIDGPDTSPRTVTVTDQADIFSVVRVFDHVRGWYDSARSIACGSPGGIVYLYAVTFHWPRHTLVVDTGQPLCGTGRKLTRDGTTLPQTLDPNDQLDATLKTAFANR